MVPDDEENHSSDDEREEECVEPEPAHSTMSRIVWGSMSALSVACIWYIFAFWITSPIEYLIILTLKLTVCGFCCPHSVQKIFRNVSLSPIRWARIAVVGSGHADCWSQQVWPFRSNMKTARILS